MRCAIYTRKSTDEGLEQSFNSLDAQREACKAFIASQKHEGWIMDDTPMMMEAGQGGHWSALLFSNCLKMFDRAAFKSL